MEVPCILDAKKMPHIVICPYCLQGYADVTLRYCLEDGTPLSIPFAVPSIIDESEVETLIRPTNAPPTESVEEPKRKRTNPKEFLTSTFRIYCNIKGGQAGYGFTARKQNTTTTGGSVS
jgi:hypothetical protein